ncbi:MAG: zinc ribbon domain-containing protein [Ruminococcus sp.]|nr:zinc ribbon domain-containing protein [Ruminococcus sp.]
MSNCPTCGLPYKEGEKFCPACGGKLPVLIKRNVCKMCGNTLIGAPAFCNICGTPTGLEPQKDKAGAPDEALKNPTMDEIQIPVVTDEMLGITHEPVKNDDVPTMDSIYMPGQEPVQQRAVPKSAASASPVITPEEAAMASKTISVAQTPTVDQTPSVSDMYSAGRQQSDPGATTVLTPEGLRSTMQQSAAAMASGTGSYGTYGASGQAGVNNGAGSVPPGSIPVNGGYIPGAGAVPQSTKPVPGKGAGALVPVILLIAIIAVILFDVFFLFKDQIFGGDKDDKNAKEDCAVVVTADDLSENEISLKILK